jgi:hypothetical protein
MLNKAALPVDKEIQVQNEDVITLRLTDRSVCLFFQSLKLYNLFMPSFIL